MSEKNNNKTPPIRNFLYLFIILLILWVVLTSSLNWQELLVGVLISLALALFLSNRYSDLGLPPISIKRILYSIAYIFVLFKEIIVANFDVAYRVLHPKMPIKPGIIIIKTDLKQDIAKTILANSITLTPGTFTLDIKDDKLLIHWIYVRCDGIAESTKEIGERFEKYLKVIFA
ncbi:Na+/H+ antiporter subunit E [bacterium]|nr:Na+/H+ antiporter subunit E [bacterium]